MRFKQDIFESKLLIVLIVLFTLVVAVLLWFVSKTYSDSLYQDHFDADVRESLDHIDKRMTRYTNALQGGIGFFYGSDRVTRDEWYQYISALNLKKNFPGMQGMGYVQMVSPEERQVLEESMRTYYSHFTIKPEGDRAQYSAILFLEPLDIRNQEAIGYDMFSQATRRAAMEKARDTGKPTTSGRVTLVQEIDNDVQAGVLIYHPYYQKHMKTDTVEERRKAIKGFVYSPYRMNDLMEKIPIIRSDIDIEIYDSPQPSFEHLLYRSFKHSTPDSRFRVQKTLKVNDRTWYVHFYSTKAFDNSLTLQTPIIVTLSGIGVSLFLLVVILSLVKGRVVMQEQTKTLHKLTQALEQSPNTAIITNVEGYIEYVNTAFVHTTGYTKEEAYGQKPSILKSGKTNPLLFTEMWKAITSGTSWEGEFINRRKDGSKYIESIKASPIFDSNGKLINFMAVKEDITKKKEDEERIYHLANFDVLTGLPNRYKLMERLNEEIKRCKRYNCHFSVIFLDLDRFKTINDTLGHSVGDKFLIELSKKLTSLLREVDVISRLSGDEFIIVLPDTDTINTVPIVDKLLKRIEKPVTMDEHELIVTASLGIAVYPEDGTDAETLTKNADTAMYRAKQRGPNNYTFYTEGMQTQGSKNLKLTNALYHALERNELYVVYQPQVEIKSNHVIALEALLRWRHPELGDISPAEFIPLAEESSLIIPIGKWVLEQAILEAKKWKDATKRPLVVAVNLSVVQFRLPNLTSMISELLDNANLPPEYLELELTESVAMQNAENAKRVIDELRDSGILLSIDDFGTGYSSLNYLRSFNLSKLKIDISFIRDVTVNSDDKALVIAIINMAKSLGLRTIAEGVETIEQLWFLRQQKCDEVQGYLYSKPLLPEELFNFLTQYSALRNTTARSGREHKLL